MAPCCSQATPFIITRSTTATCYFMSVADLVQMYECFDYIRAQVGSGEVHHLVAGQNPGHVVSASARRRASTLAWPPPSGRSMSEHAGPGLDGRPSGGAGAWDTQELDRAMYRTLQKE